MKEFALHHSIALSDVILRVATRSCHRCYCISILTKLRGSRTEEPRWRGIQNHILFSFKLKNRSIWKSHIVTKAIEEKSSFYLQNGITAYSELQNEMLDSFWTISFDQIFFVVIKPLAHIEFVFPVDVSRFYSSSTQTKVKEIGRILTASSIKGAVVLGSFQPGRTFGRPVEVCVPWRVESFICRHSEIQRLNRRKKKYFRITNTPKWLNHRHLYLIELTT